MLSDLIKGKKYTYKLLLCKMNTEPICCIPYSDLTFTEKFNDYNELNFSVPKYIDSWKDNKRTQIINPAWEKIMSGSLVLASVYNGYDIVHQEYFSVSDFGLSSDETAKSINAESAHQILFNHLKLWGYNDTRKLYDFTGDFHNNTSVPINFNTSDYTEGGILNYIIEYKLNNKNYSNDDNFWKVTYYDTALDNLFEGDTITETMLESLKNNVALYWRISRDNTNFNNYTGNLTACNLTVYNWYHNCLNMLKNHEITDIYYNRLDFENKLNLIYENLDYVCSVLGNDNSTQASITNFNNLLNDPYIGTKALSLTEDIIANLQSFIDSIMTANTIGETEGMEVIDDSMTIFKDLTENLFEPLLIFKGYSGKRPYRTLSFDGDNLTDVFAQLAESYMCIFVFDNVHRTIKIYSRNNKDISDESRLIISPNNFIASIQRQDNTEQVLTRLYIKGKNDATIAGISPNGQRYYDDFSYFRNSNYMSDKLLEALDKYDNRVKTFVSEQGFSLLEEINWYDQKIETKQKDYDYKYDYYIKNENAEKEYAYIGELLSNEKNESKKNEYKNELNALWLMMESYYAVLSNGESVEELKEQINDLLAAKVNLQKSFLYENVTDSNGNKIFTDELTAELEYFIFEGDLTVDTISDDNALLYYAQNYISYINKIPVTIDVSLVDILDNPKFQSVWNKLNKVGDYIMIDYSPFHLNKEYCKLMSYTHNPVSCELNLQFSNYDDLQNEFNTLIEKVWKYSFDLSKSADKYKDSWEEYLQKKELYLQEGQDIDTGINAIMSNGKKVIDGNGIVLSKQPSNTAQQLNDGFYVNGTEIKYTNPQTGIERVLVVKDDGVYQREGENEYMLRPVHVVDKMPDDDEIIQEHIYLVKSQEDTI